MGEDEFQLDTEGEPGERKTKKMQDLKMPKRTEGEVHNLTHLPFRSWCRHCVQGRWRAGRAVFLGRGEGSAQHDHGNGGQGAEYQDDGGHGCASEECEIV